MSFAQYTQPCGECGLEQRVVLIGEHEWVEESKTREVICRQCAYGMRPNEDGRGGRNATEALKHRPFFDLDMNKLPTVRPLGGGLRRD